MKMFALAIFGTGFLGSVMYMGATTQTKPVGPGAKVTKRNVGNNPGNVRAGGPLRAQPGNELLMVSAGCFWGIEDWMREQPGVVSTAVGYAGGWKPNPTYQQVCYTRTGHAETVLVEFDPKKISYNQLLKEFWLWIDPTILNRQGPDIGDQYRTAIWVFDQKQLDIAMESRSEEQKNWKKRIVTPVANAPKFWIAEEYHQQYDEKTGKKSCAPRTGMPIKN